MEGMARPGRLGKGLAQWCGVGHDLLQQALEWKWTSACTWLGCGIQAVARGAFPRLFSMPVPTVKVPCADSKAVVWSHKEGGYLRAFLGAWGPKNACSMPHTWSLSLIPSPTDSA